MVRSGDNAHGTLFGEAIIRKMELLQLHALFNEAAAQLAEYRALTTTEASGGYTLDQTAVHEQYKCAAAHANTHAIVGCRLRPHVCPRSYVCPNPIARPGACTKAGSRHTSASTA